MTALAILLAVGSGGAAHAAPDQSGPAATATATTSRATTGTAGRSESLPAGWELRSGAAGPKLVWHAAAPVPLSDAGVMFYAGDEPLGRPVADRDQRTFALDVADVPGRDLADLQARAGSHRLDATGGSGQPGTRRMPANGTQTAPLPDPLPPAAVDPGEPGGYRTVSGEYTLDGVRLPSLPEPVEMQGVVVAPENAPGPRPLVLFLHGRHNACYRGSAFDPGWPCAAGARSIPSYHGYRYAQLLLASQGYVTVSIAANGINGQDDLAQDGGTQARSSLIRLHLARWADWSGGGRFGAPAVVRSAARADLSQVLLVGHSRGGEGANRAAMDSLVPPPAELDGYHGQVRWQIKGTVLIGPTAQGHDPVPDVPSVSILPGCDGDISDLQGQVYVDRTRGMSRGEALHSAIYVIGGNHNFFNTEWTPGLAEAPAWDDFRSDPDPLCSTGTATRLTPAQQQAVGATYLAAGARLFVRGDDRVRPLLDGSGVRAPSAGPARVLSHAVGAARTPVLIPDTSTGVSGGARLCQTRRDAALSCYSTGVASPHFAFFTGVPDPNQTAVLLQWSAPDTAAQMRPAQPVSVAGADMLALRIIVPSNSTGTSLDVAVTDTSGRRAVLGQARLDGLPGSMGELYADWAQEVRLPLAAAGRAGVDAHRIAELELVPRSQSGTAYLLDAWGWRPGTPALHPAELLRLDIGSLSVDEGDSGTRTYQSPVWVSGHGQGTVWLVDLAKSPTGYQLVTVPDGADQLSTTVTVSGNTRFGYDRRSLNRVEVLASRGVMIGNFMRTVTIRNDDPMPEISFTPVADRVTEGSSLRWQMTLSAAADDPICPTYLPLAPQEGAELSTTDVDPEWMQLHHIQPEPSRSLSSLRRYIYGSCVRAGDLTGEFAIPTIADDQAEPEERVALQASDEVTWKPLGVTLTGTVLDRP